MTYELWDLVSRNLIDFVEDRREAIDIVQAYVDADEAGDVVLLEHGGDDTSTETRTLTGHDLIRWLESARADIRRSA